ncbi:MAG: ABC transporter permease, partial [Verrucomicrobiota bacterium]|nr:ABC transporter permease [Verrucomicrobiota bacterium]
MIVNDVIISLTTERISLACVLVMILALTTWKADLRVARPLLVASFRLIVQLSLVGLILEYVFEINNFLLIALIALVMLLVAGKEVSGRQK